MAPIFLISIYIFPISIFWIFVVLSTVTQPNCISQQKQKDFTHYQLEPENVPERAAWQRSEHQIASIFRNVNCDHPQSVNPKLFIALFLLNSIAFA